MAYQYQLYGLKITSSIKLNKLPFSAFKDEADFSIKKEKLRRPAKGRKQTLYKPFSVIGNNFFYLDVKGIARYKAADKHTIIVDKYKNANWQEVVLFLLDSVFECMLVFHEKFILKASSISYKNKAYLFCGLNGVGKSALAASLHHKKIKIIEDDKCLLQWNAASNCFVVKNQYPYAALWADVEGWQKFSELKKMKPLRKGIKKYEYDISKIVEKRTLPVKKIYALKVESALENINKKEIKGLVKANLIRQFVPKHHLISPFGKVKPYFKFLSLLANQIDFIHLERTRSTSLNKFAAFVKEELYRTTVA